MSKGGSSAIVAERGFGTKFVDWCRKNLPTRESMEESRLLRPVAHRVLAPALWRFTRRSVPRGVALGMVTGVLAPVAQIPISAVLALPLRANIPAAALTTFITNPFTTPPLWVFAYWLGHKLLYSGAAAATDAAMVANAAASESWSAWLVGEAWQSWLLGMTIVSVAGAALGYALTAIGWRIWIARKWKARGEARQAARASAAKTGD